MLLSKNVRCKASTTAIYKSKKREEELTRIAHEAEEDKAYCEEQNRKAQEKIADAISIIQNGGVLKNEAIEFFRSRYDSSSYSIVNYLLRLYHIDVPLRTQG